MTRTFARAALCALALGLSVAAASCGGGGGHGGGSGNATFTNVYAADGKGGTAGNLYLVTPPPAVTSTTIGALPVPIGAMATRSDGTTFGIPNANSAAAGSLWRIDTTTPSLSTVVAQLQNATGTAYDSIAGISFRGNTLFGWVADGSDADGNDNELVTIDTTTGLVTAIGHASFTSWQGNGLSFASDGTLYATSFTNSDQILVTLDPSTGTPITFTAVTMNSTTNGALKSLLTVEDQLLGVEINTGGANGSSLVLVNPTTVSTTALGLLPPKVSAITFAP